MNDPCGLSNPAVKASNLLFDEATETFGLVLIGKQTVKLWKRALLVEFDDHWLPGPSFGGLQLLKDAAQPVYNMLLLGHVRLARRQVFKERVLIHRHLPRPPECAHSVTYSATSSDRCVTFHCWQRR